MGGVPEESSPPKGDEETVPAGDTTGPARGEISHDEEVGGPVCRPSLTSGFVSAEEAVRSSESFRRRYAVREDEQGERYLTCTEAPNITVRIERGLTVTSGQAKKAPRGTIYLDGAAAAEPFMDVQRRVYNLDHHEGCVRSFTFATCEQAMVLVLKRLDLKSDEWTIWANEPDLDTVLAIWVLLNHVRLSSDESEPRDAIMPLIRLEGLIDAGGLKFAALSGFPPELQAQTMETIEHLRQEELAQKQKGCWSNLDFLEYTLGVLRAIDVMVYSPCDFATVPDIEEITRVPLTPERIGVVCRAGSGIYEVERGLSQLHGDRVGLIVLEKSPGTYTLRQVDSFLPVSLESLYERLNMLDPNVNGEGNHWGGSQEIGGSPRRTGTALTPAQIADVIQWVYQPPSRLRRIGWTAAAAAGATVLSGLALASAALNDGGGHAVEGWTSLAQYAEGGLFALVLVVLAGGALGLLGRRRRLQFGLTLPHGWHWAPLALAGIVAGAIGGAWTAPPEGGLLSTLPFLILLPLAAEGLHRGVIHGLLSDLWNVQHTGGRWFLSVPTIASASISAALSIVLFLPQHLARDDLGWWLIPLWVAGAAGLGLACGMIRERSASLIPAAGTHLLAALWAAYLPGVI